MWPLPIIPTIRKLGQESHEFKSSLGYSLRFGLKNYFNKYITGEGKGDPREVR